VNEVARIAMLARLLAGRAAGVEVGIGDDAAVLAGAPANTKLVWTIDEQVEGTHFRRDLLSMRDVGWRSLMAAASDVAAMGARPWCVLAALSLPEDVGDEALAAIAGGQAEAAHALGAPVVGGNLARGPVLSIATTVLGCAERPVLRAGARPGDVLWLAGSVGLAAAGLRALERAKGDDDRLAVAVAAWRTPVALVEAGVALGRGAHAAIDVSDGVARDAGHVADASGVRLVLEESELLRDDSLVGAAAALGEDPIDLALHGGEDYAIVAASPGPLPGFRRIGEVLEGRGLVLRSATGERPIEPRGFDHFAAPGARD
jgi:thiamine-monophosphate kinase